MGSYSDLLLGGGQSEPAPQTRYSDLLLGGAESTSERRDYRDARAKPGFWESIKGRQDPAYAGTRSIAEVVPDVVPSTATAAMLNASDPQMGDVVAKNLGDRLVRREKDANGYEVLTVRQPDGTEARGYVNVPGLDRTDIWRGVYGAVPFALSATAAGKAAQGLGVVGNALAQGGAAGLTSLAGDAALIPQGSEQGLEGTKAAIAAGLGAAGPPVSAAAGALWRKFVTIPGLYDRTTGQLTQKGIDAARKANLDPADFTPDMAEDFARGFAKSGDAEMAATKATTGSFDIPATQGQIKKDPYLLTQEEKLRRRLYGEDAQQRMQQFDALQQQRIREGAFEGSGATQGVGDTINPGSSINTARPGTLGESVQDAAAAARREARTQESALWDDNVKNLAATPDALKELAPRITTALAEETGFTPTGQKMAEAVTSFAEGKLPTTEVGAIKLKPIQSVDQMRRHLGGLVGEAQEGSDRRQAGMIYDAFNDWIGESAQKNLLAGDPGAALQLVKARGFTKDVRELFSPKDARGRLTSGGARLGKVLDESRADSGESVVNALFGPQGGKTAGDGTVQALTQLKTVLDRFGGAQGQQAWNDVRLAYWSRLVLGKNGEMVGSTAIMNNIKTAFQNQRTVLETLYSPQELGMMRRYMTAVAATAYKPPNASGSGYVVGNVLQEIIGQLFGKLPAYVDSAFNMVGGKSFVGNARARQALSQSIPAANPALSPAVSGAGAVYAREQDR